MKKRRKPCVKESLVIKEIEQIMRLYNLIDVWPNLKPHMERFTWRNKSLKNQCSLDFFLISKDLGNLVTSCKILLAPESDHSAITLHLRSDDL